LKFHLGPLDRIDTRAYVEHRLAVAGRGDGKLFADDVFPLIYRYTGGVPRLINTLCDSALLVAFADGKETITASDIEDTAEELEWVEHEDTTGEHEVLPRLVPGAKKTIFLTRIDVRTKGKKKSEHFFEAGRIIVGRSPDSDIYIDSNYISRHHLQLTSSASGCIIEDLNSTNGVFIGKDEVKKQILTDGDIISLGTHELLYADLRDADEISKDDTSVNENQA
jgi:hypothetical protein